MSKQLHLCMLIISLLIILLLLCLGGCAAQNKDAGTGEFIFSSGCLLYVDGTNVEIATAVQELVQLEDCKILIEETRE